MQHDEHMKAWHCHILNVKIDGMNMIWWMDAMGPLAKQAALMNPVNANDAWWEGFRAYYENETTNPHSISGPNGEEVPAYWYFEAGWWYAALSLIRELEDR